jgi:hypothetical protein
VFSSDLPGVNPATLNGVILYYRLMTKWSSLGDSTELSRMGLSQGASRPGSEGGEGEGWPVHPLRAAREKGRVFFLQEYLEAEGAGGR